MTAWALLLLLAAPHAPPTPPVVSKASPPATLPRSDLPLPVLPLPDLPLPVLPLPALPPPTPTPGVPTDAQMLAPRQPPRTGARAVIVAGAALMVTGVMGMLASPGCRTRDHRGRCVDQAGSDDLYPALFVVGLGVSATGAWWFRHDLPDDEP